MEHKNLYFKEETKMSVKALLNDEIKDEIEQLRKVELGSDQHKIAADALAKLLDKSIEMDKLDLEYQDRFEAREAENELKQKEIEDEKKDRKVKNILTGVSVIGGFALTVWGTCKSIKFEETGSFTTIMGRGFIQKLLPKK